MLLAARVNATRFFEGLTSGDPVAIGIAVVVVLFMAFGAWQKFRSMSPSHGESEA